MRLHKCNITVNLNFDREPPDTAGIDAAELIQELLSEDFSEDMQELCGRDSLIKLLHIRRKAAKKE